jgi:hypothetical protein
MKCLPRTFVMFAALVGFAGVSRGDVLDEIYGKGVHAFFGGDLLRSQQLLDLAIESGSQDPRVHIFRGLVASRLSGLDAAAEHFQRGSELEIAGRRSVSLDRALQRIQGPERHQIEEARMMARLQDRLTRPQGAPPSPQWTAPLGEPIPAEPFSRGEARQVAPPPATESAPPAAQPDSVDPVPQPQPPEPEDEDPFGL